MVLHASVPVALGPEVAPSVCSTGTDRWKQTKPAKLYGYLHLFLEPDASESDSEVRVGALRFAEATLTESAIRCVNGDTSFDYGAQSETTINEELLPRGCSKHDPHYPDTKETISGHVSYANPFAISGDCVVSSGTSDGVRVTRRQSYRIDFTPCPPPRPRCQALLSHLEFR
jgi:hypothetical protein